MILSRTTPCTLFKINAPMWGGGKRVVGLDQRRISKHNEIMFTYVRKSDGMRSMPDNFYFDGDKLKQVDFQRHAIKGTILVLVPFNELERLERE